MCGLTGSWEPRGARDGDELKRVVRNMARLAESRGPDDAGEWADPDAGIALGHRRLSIVDLSPRGRQPMVSAGGALVIAYNGEIYNFPELRAELEAEGVSFRGGSDTEVLLEACAAWGIERALGRCIGMFAIALWDRTSHRLHLVRDRLGVKPLYWARLPRGLLTSLRSQIWDRLARLAPERLGIIAFLTEGETPHESRTADRLPPAVRVPARRVVGVVACPRAEVPGRSRRVLDRARQPPRLPCLGMGREIRT